MISTETRESATGAHVSVWGDLLGVDLHQHFVDAGGIRTRVLEAGSGPALVMVHGTGGHLEAYARNVRAFSEHYRLVLYDMIGHGYTEKPDRPYTIDVMSDHLVAVLDALGIERAHLSGESIGGWVAAWTAAYHPQRVNRLVLNTPGNITSKPQVMAAVRDSSLKAVREASTETVRARVEWLFHDTTHVTDELVALRLAIYTQPGFERAMENIVAVQNWEYREPYVWSPQWCGQMGADPVAVDRSRPDWRVDEAELLREWIPDARIEIIEGAGHWPQWEKPDEFHRAHLRFLNGGI